MSIDLTDEMIRRAKISGMTNADLFDAFEQSVLDVSEGRPGSLGESWALQAELERRLQRIGFLPPTERLSEIRKARAGK